MLRDREKNLFAFLEFDMVHCVTRPKLIVTISYIFCFVTSQEKRAIRICLFAKIQGSYFIILCFEVEHFKQTKYDSIGFSKNFLSKNYFQIASAGKWKTFDVRILVLEGDKLGKNNSILSALKQNPTNYKKYWKQQKHWKFDANVLFFVCRSFVTSACGNGWP